MISINKKVAYALLRRDYLGERKYCFNYYYFCEKYYKINTVRIAKGGYKTKQNVIHCRNYDKPTWALH